MLIEPAEFYANPETMGTNPYQVDEHEPPEVVLKKAIKEFRNFRNMLVENGVIVTTARGHVGCPDHLFPNWVSTHENNGMVLYPMLNENRRQERTPDLIAALSNIYDVVEDLTDWENQGLMLESTGSIVMDRINKVGYAGLSARTSRGAAEEWGRRMGYEMVLFETRGHTGQPIYHTDLVISIGTEVAAIAAECITDEYRDMVLSRLSKTHDIIEYSAEQQQSFCGNSLEVLGEDDKRMLVMSDKAFGALTEQQINKLSGYFDRILHAPLPTIEAYGGGSARCLMLELF